MSPSVSRGLPAGSAPLGDAPPGALPDTDQRRALARVAAAVAAGDEPVVEAAARSLAGRLSRRCLEEVVLQTYLFAGFPAAINGFIALERGWPREEEPERAPEEPARAHEPGRDAAADGDADRAGDWELWRARGERLCERVYGETYPRLRDRMCELSPALDEWAVVEGYGKTLSRPGLDEATRELCAVAALGALGAARQLAAHLEGARRLGVGDGLLTETAREAIQRHAPPSRRVGLAAPLEATGER